MLNQDYREILQVLKKNEVDFIVVGAYALAAHGYPRSTVDIDENTFNKNCFTTYYLLSLFDYCFAALAHGLPVKWIPYNAPFVEGISLILLSMLVPWSIAFAKALKIASTI